MSFAKIQDQEVALRLLRNILRLQRVPNGLLFKGPAGVGKRLTAHEFAKALACPEGEADACDACLPCRKVDHGNHPDVKVIQPSGRTREILRASVDFMNELSTYRPFEGKWRTFIIEDAERMRLEAQNHFLKTLEEPPSNTNFVLVTEHARRLLPTIRSRCQEVRFGALQPATVAQLLQERHEGLSAEQADAVAAVSQGQMSRAMDLIESEKREVVLDLMARLDTGEDPLLLSEEFVKHLKKQREALRAIAKAEASQEEEQDLTREERENQDKALTAYVEGLVRKDLMEYLYLIESWRRDCVVYSRTQDLGLVLNRDRAQQLAARRADAAEDGVSAVEKAWRYIERNLNMERVFRDLFFALAPRPIQE